MTQQAPAVAVRVAWEERTGSEWVVLAGLQVFRALRCARQLPARIRIAIVSRRMRGAPRAG